MVRLTKKTIAAVLISVALVLFMAWPGLWWFFAKNLNPAPSIGFSDGQDTAGWKTYADSRQGFEFKYPEGFEIGDNNKPPSMPGAKGEITVARIQSAGKSGVLLAIDSFDEDIMSVGGIDFLLGGEKGFIGCSWGGDCRIYLENRKTVILAKSAVNPARMIDGEAKNILATLKFFEPSGWKVE